MEYPIAKNLFDLVHKQAQTFTHKNFVHYKSKQNDQWLGTSFKKFKQDVLHIASALKQYGVEEGDRVIILSESRTEWLVADCAIMALGAISVPVYTTNTVEDNAYIITDSGAKTAFVSSQALLETFLPAAVRLNVHSIFGIECMKSVHTQSAHIHQWDDIIKTPIDADIETYATNIDINTTACLIYTSGTSGNPTGVALSHRAILANVYGGMEVIKEFGKPLDSYKLVSFLPLSHSYEHTTGFFLMFAMGCSVYFSPSIEKLLPTIQSVKPHFVTCVPRLYENIYARVKKSMQKQSPLTAKLFEETLRLGQKKYEDQSLSLLDTLKNSILTLVVRKKIKKIFGGNLTAFVSGGAPLNYDIGIFFTAMGMTILQGYGQTETAPLISVNPPNDNRIDTVGKPLPGVEVKLAPDSEILVRGDLLMNGYWNRPRKTQETIIDGWLHTGDVGTIDADGYIKITDRKKDIIINTGGDNISPQRIEGILCLSPAIEQCMVYGDQKPHMVALIVPDANLLQQYGNATNNPDLIQHIQQQINITNKTLSTIERIRRFAIADEAFTKENELLTATLKIRRKFITEKYKTILEKLYT